MSERDGQPGRHPGQGHRRPRRAEQYRAPADLLDQAHRLGELRPGTLRPGTIHAVGWPQRSRTTGANVSAGARPRTGRLPTGRWRRTATRRRRPNRRRWPTRPRRAAAPGSGASPRPTSSVLPTAWRPGPGSASSPAAGSPAPARSRPRRAPTAVREAPSTEARAVSRDDAHTASSSSPGSTTGTSRCEASGCHGTTAGSHSTVSTDQTMIRNGSPHSRTAEAGDRGSRAASRRTASAAPPVPAAARAPPPPAREQHRGHPEVPQHPGEARLEVLARPVDRQPLKPLQRRDLPDHGRVGLPANGLQVRPDGQPGKHDHRQHEGQPGKQVPSDGRTTRSPLNHGNSAGRRTLAAPAPRARERQRRDQRRHRAEAGRAQPDQVQLLDTLAR